VDKLGAIEPLGDQLERSIASGELSRLGEEGFDDAFASVRDAGEELLPAIPIIRYLHAAYKTSRAISNRLLAKKIGAFLFQLETISPEQREAFLSKLETKERHRIFETLMLVLDKHDRVEKSEIEGRLFRAFVQGELDQREFWDLTHATSMINVESLPELAKFYAGEISVDASTSSLFYSFGFLRLLELDNSHLGDFGGGSVEFQKTELGQKYVRLAL
jgi:hypothetical protein